MTRNRLIAGCIVFAAVGWPALAATRHYAVSAEQVAASVTGLGVQLMPDQVSLLTDVTATTPTPSLQVRFVERVEADRFMVRLECGSQEDCMPFIASVHASGETATRLSAVSLRSSLRGSLSSSDSNTRSDAVFMRSGSRAILQLDNEHVHIRIPVICLESGVAGKTIRVTDKDHTRVYSAQVVQAGLLQGRF
jgi:hypothetical protein